MSINSQKTTIQWHENMTPPTGKRDKPRCAVYARVSTMQQAKVGYSLGSQLDSCRKHAENQGYRVTATIEEIGSGDLEHRPGFVYLEMLAALGMVEAIAYYGDDRLSRDPESSRYLYAVCRSQGVKLIDVFDENNPEIVQQLHSGIAQAVGRYLLTTVVG